jgi:pyrroline-5-carboxylate reductase
MKVGVIGYGSMGKMLLEKLPSNSDLIEGKLFVANRSYEKIADLAAKYHLCQNNQEIAKLVDILFICVRPVDMKKVLEEIKNNLRKEQIIVSLNGSITFEQIESVCKNKIVKAIPSVMAEINKSQTLICCNSMVNEQDKASIKDLLSCIGSVIELPESEMGMGSELVSCMPGFIAAIFDEICMSAQKHTSIEADEVVQMVLNTMIGTGQLMIENNYSYQDVITRVATKGGITEEGVKVIQETFPQVSDAIFDKTLEKRSQTTLNAQKVFRE